MSDATPDIFAGARDVADGHESLAERFRRHADSLERSRRSPLCVQVMRGAARDIESGGITAQLLGGIPLPPGAVPALRLLAALHLLVLRGRAARLATYYPSAGGDRSPDGVWLGDPASPVRFVEPWQRAPQIDLAEASRGLRIVERGGCDLVPLDPAEPDDRLTLLSYIWPDEPERLARTEAAMDLAARHPPAVRAEPADRWLAMRLQAPPEAALTVIWHSLFVQYLSPEAWAALQAAFRPSTRADAAAPVVWLSMEPRHDHIRHVELTVRGPRDIPERRLAHCEDHGPPLIWEPGS